MLPVSVIGKEADKYAFAGFNSQRFTVKVSVAVAVSRAQIDYVIVKRNVYLFGEMKVITAAVGIDKGCRIVIDNEQLIFVTVKSKNINIHCLRIKTAVKREVNRIKLIAACCGDCFGGKVDFGIVDRQGYRIVTRTENYRMSVNNLCVFEMDCVIFGPVAVVNLNFKTQFAFGQNKLVENEFTVFGYNGFAAVVVNTGHNNPHKT